MFRSSFYEYWKFIVHITIDFHYSQSTECSHNFVPIINVYYLKKSNFAQEKHFTNVNKIRMSFTFELLLNIMHAKIRYMFMRSSCRPVYSSRRQWYNGAALNTCYLNIRNDVMPSWCVFVTMIIWATIIHKSCSVMLWDNELLCISYLWKKKTEYMLVTNISSRIASILLR